MNSTLRKKNLLLSRIILIFFVTILQYHKAIAESPSQLQPSEYEIKAAFIYNFAKFVEWPLNSKQTSCDSMIIGILGHDPFGFIMEQVIGGKTVGGKMILIERYNTIDEARQCHILFISDSERLRVKHIIKALSDHHILTVGDMEGFIQQGGMIYLYMQEKRIRFIINMDATKDANLKLSSKLLKLADVVRNSE